MAGVRGFLADHKIGVSVVTASLVVLGGVAVAGTPGGDVVTVRAVVDGDTIDVSIDGADERVRLLNIDTPEVGECLHDEATTFLEERLPVGTEVDLEYDKERTDRYGRVLAGVVEAGHLVNAEIARNGLGVAVLIEPNGRFFDDVLAARDAAAAEGLGLFSEGISCTLPAQVGEYVSEVEELEAGVGTGTLEEIDGWVADAAAVAATGAALVEVLDGDDAVFPLLAYTGPRWTLREDVEAATGRVTEVERALVEARQAEEQRVKEEQERREREEAERREREEAERREQEAQAQREREEIERQAAAERQEAERRAAEAAAEEQRRQSSSSSGSSSSGSSGGGSAYYKNCAAARAAGAAPVVVGDPGYARHLDRDGDGIGCE